MPLPTTSIVRLEPSDTVLTAWLDDPASRNALTTAMRRDLVALVDHLESGPPYRLLVVRGAGGTFCSGADLKAFKDPPATAAAGPDPIAADNRDYGTFLARFNALPVVTIALVEGAAFGGALGLLCVTDVVIALADARFSMSETTLGLVPAQIAPFVVQRVGLTHARRLALTGIRFDGEEAARLGIAHEVRSDVAAAEARLGGGIL